MRITQTDIANLRTYCIIPQEVKSLVILLHGYGSNGTDLISLAEEWAPHCSNTAFISPDAFYPCEMGNAGYQWFSLADHSRDVMTSLIQTEWRKLSAYIDAALDKYDIPNNRLVLSGFSQGCMMALHTGFARDNACAGILGYSGMLLDADVVKNTKNKSMPVCLIHGDDDPVVPVDAWDEATAIMSAKGIKVSGHKTAGLQHGIDMNGVHTGLKFIRSVLK